MKEKLEKTESFHKKINEIDDEFKEIIINEEKLNYNINEKKKIKQKKIKYNRESVKELSKEALSLLREKSSYLSKVFESNEIKDQENDINNSKKNKYIQKGFVSNLLLNDNTDSLDINEKLSLSRKKTRLEKYIHTQYIFNCQIQALLAMVTILTSILEYENTVISVGKEKVIHTFRPYNSEANNYNYAEDYYNKHRKTSRVCSYISFILSIFLWLSIYYDKILFHILLKGYQEKSYKIIISDNKQIFRLISSILFFFLCPNPFTYGIEINFNLVYF